jgi:hypothetical protein
MDERQSLGVLAPPRNPSSAQGRYPIPIDLDSVRQLAALRLPDYAIASKLGISDETFSIRKRNYPEMNEAIRLGRADAQQELAEALKASINNKTQGTIERIFLAKQSPEKGGLGFVDRIDHSHSGKVEHVMLPALDKWREAKQLAQGGEVIEAEYEEID